MDAREFFTVATLTSIACCATFIAVAFIDRSLLAVLMATMCLYSACECYAVVCEIKNRDRRNKWTR